MNVLWLAQLESIHGKPFVVFVASVGQVIFTTSQHLEGGDAREASPAL